MSAHCTSMSSKRCSYWIRSLIDRGPTEPSSLVTQSLTCSTDLLSFQESLRRVQTIFRQLTGESADQERVPRTLGSLAVSRLVVRHQPFPGTFQHRRHSHVDPCPRGAGAPQSLREGRGDRRCCERPGGGFQVFRETFFSGGKTSTADTMSYKTLEIVDSGVSAFFRFSQVSSGI